MKRDIKDELKNDESKNTESTTTKCIDQDDASNRYAASGVYFRCPLLGLYIHIRYVSVFLFPIKRVMLAGAEILTKIEWRNKIKEYLYEQMESERGLTACLIIRNCNTNEDKVICIPWIFFSSVNLARINLDWF